MGVAIAREAFRRGAEVTVVHGPVKVRVPEVIERIPVTTACEMHEAMIDLAYPVEGGGPDIVIMTAAVADYRPKESSDHKMKKNGKLTDLKLVPNPDILSDLGSRRTDDNNPRLIGFAVETGELEDLLTEATNKLEKKNADMIVGNFAEEAFDLNTNRVWLVDKHGRRDEVATSFKSRIANKILDRILKL
jgi:phosphopantothenoylcysteine decarboxylase/phosphopantothenate--cysteine ligase